MREAIEKVIAELFTEHKRNWELERKNISLEQQYYRQGGQDGLTFAIEKLQEVIATESNNQNRGNTAQPERNPQPSPL